MNQKEILAAAKKRSAIKVFNNKTISDADFEFILEVARYSPSSFGLEPWNIIVLQNKKIRNEISAFAAGAQKQLGTASHFVIFTVKKDIAADSQYFEHINKDVKGFDDTGCKNFVESFGAFCERQLNLYDGRTRRDWAAKQAYLALGNMLLAASELDIDSCAMEGFLIKETSEVLAKYNIIDLAEDEPVVLAAFGYRAEDPPYAKARRSIDEIVKFVR